MPRAMVALYREGMPDSYPLRLILFVSACQYDAASSTKRGKNREIEEERERERRGERTKGERKRKKERKRREEEEERETEREEDSWFVNIHYVCAEKGEGCASETKRKSEKRTGCETTLREYMERAEREIRKNLQFYEYIKGQGKKSCGKRIFFTEPM